MPITAEHAIYQGNQSDIPMLPETATPGVDTRPWRDPGVVSIGISPDTRLDIAEQLLKGGESATRIVQGERGLYAVIFTPVDGLTEKEREMGQAAVRGAKRSLELAGRRSRTPEEEVKYLSKYKDAVIRASSVFDYSIVRLPDLPAGRPDQSPAVVDNVNNPCLLEDNNHTDRVRQHPLNAVLSGFVAFTTAGSAIPPSYPAPPAHVWHAAGETEPGIAIYEPKAPQQGPEEDWGGCGFFLKKEVTIVSSYYNTSSVLPAGTEVRVLGWTGDGRCHIEADGVQGFVPKDALSENLEPVFSATYTVLLGDTLTQIAERYGSTVTEIVRLNGLADPNQIQAGQKLQIPTLGEVGGEALVNFDSSKTDIAIKELGEFLNIIDSSGQIKPSAFELLPDANGNSVIVLIKGGVNGNPTGLSSELGYVEDVKSAVARLNQIDPTIMRLFTEQYGLRAITYDPNGTFIGGREFYVASYNSKKGVIFVNQKNGNGNWKQNPGTADMMVTILLEARGIGFDGGRISNKINFNTGVDKAIWILRWAKQNEDRLTSEELAIINKGATSTLNFYQKEKPSIDTLRQENWELQKESLINPRRLPIIPTESVIEVNKAFLAIIEGYDENEQEYMIFWSVKGKVYRDRISLRNISRIAKWGFKNSSWFGEHGIAVNEYTLMMLEKWW